MSNLFSPHSAINNFFDLTIFQNSILFWILLNHEEIEKQILEKGMLSFAFGAILLAVLFYAGIGISYSADGRISIFGDNQNNIGVRICISLIILLLTVFQNNLNIGKYRFLLLLPIPLMVHLMALSASRVAIVSFLLSFIAGAFLLRSATPLRKVAIIGVSIIIFAIVIKTLLNTEVLRLRILQSIQERDLSGRELIWQKIMPLIKEHPIFGMGRVGYNYFVENTFGEIKSPHNVFLEILCYTGIVGLAIYFWFLVQLIKIAFKTYTARMGIMPLILLIPVFGVLMSGQILSVKIGWIIFAYIAGHSINSYHIQAET
jgi:O-antigen ligase